jgi:GNAT superfamily N-acetyltransferase
MVDLPRQLVLDLELSEVEVCRSLADMPAAVAQGIGLDWRSLGSGIATAASRADVLMYNRVVGLGVVAPAEPGDLDAATEFFATTGSPRFMVNLAPAATPPELPQWLMGRGFALHNYWIKLWRAASQTVEEPPDPRVRPIGAEHAETFGRCEAEAFGLPETVIPWFAATVGMKHWHHYAAFDGEEPAGFGALLIAGRVGWLGFATTKPSHRRQGVQSALIATRLRAAAALGCEMVVVETADDTPQKPNPSTHNLVRMGFQVAYRRPNWVKKIALELPPSHIAAEAMATQPEVATAEALAVETEKPAA